MYRVGVGEKKNEEVNGPWRKSDRSTNFTPLNVIYRTFISHPFQCLHPIKRFGNIIGYFSRFLRFTEIVQSRSRTIQTPHGQPSPNYAFIIILIFFLFLSVRKYDKINGKKKVFIFMSTEYCENISRRIIQKNCILYATLANKFCRRKKKLCKLCTKEPVK